MIPCLDCHDGKVVKGIQFQQLRTIGSPIELAQKYEEQGADELTVLDISATLETRRTRIQTIKEIRQHLSIPITAGGGIRSIDDCEDLLNAGADKISINSAAVNNPSLIEEIAMRFGSQCCVLAIDAIRRLKATSEKEDWVITTHGGKHRTDLSAINWAKDAAKLGAGEILLTSMDQDGMQTGYDLQLISAVAEAVTIPVIASGGASTPHHFFDGYRAGANALLAASIFHEDIYTITEIKRVLFETGIPIRL